MNGPRMARPMLLPDTTEAQLRRTTPLTWASSLERMTGIEPAYSAWEADVLPLNYIRIVLGQASTLTLGDRHRPVVTSVGRAVHGIL